MDEVICCLSDSLSCALTTESAFNRAQDVRTVRRVAATYEHLPFIISPADGEHDLMP